MLRQTKLEALNNINGIYYFWPPGAGSTIYELAAIVTDKRVAYKHPYYCGYGCPKGALS
jgi:hypothetical protein